MVSVPEHSPRRYIQTTTKYMVPVNTTRYSIHDRAEVARVVEVIVREVGRGNEVATAANVGISQPTLNRLRRSALDSIAHATAIALEHAAKQVGETDAFTTAVISPAALRLYRNGYKPWCVERVSRFEERTLGIHPDVAREGIRQLWHLAHAEFPEQFKRLAAAMAKRRVDETRERIAVIRILEPLLESPASGGIERRWTDLSPRERRDFIDAGIKRELIMLNREPALVIAKRLAE
jgi:hypothetical protein